jgi:hypothetical protein
MTTEVPPSAGPEIGLTPVTAGGLVAAPAGPATTSRARNWLAITTETVAIAALRCATSRGLSFGVQVEWQPPSGRADTRALRGRMVPPGMLNHPSRRSGAARSGRAPPPAPRWRTASVNDVSVRAAANLSEGFLIRTAPGRPGCPPQQPIRHASAAPFWPVGTGPPEGAAGPGSDRSPQSGSALPPAGTNRLRGTAVEPSPTRPEEVHHGSGTQRPHGSPRAAVGSPRR